ncbi:MAG TPA: YkvA family protein [Caldimonas sp.]|jgi:uncharacterized membrane protein YkvA (DUF1232 family)|nr:YkvA family protein [Caldimonas sp.]HEX2542416.1 YkvA family protein [Caldimonas sp.]
MWKRLTLLWSIARGDARRLWIALRHPAAPTWLKVGTALIVLYVLSPIDLLPDVLPVIGIVDDLILVPLAIRWLLDRLPPGIADAAGHRQRPDEGRPGRRETRRLNSSRFFTRR